MRRLLPALVLVLAAALPAAAEISVTITHPRAGEASYGEFDFQAEVVADEPVEAVEFYADGKLVGTATAPPYRIRLDVGYENQEHRYRVVAKGRSGALGEGTLLTPAIQVDMQLDVELQQLYVTVSRSGRRDLYLAREDFQIFDDGEPQEIVTFERGDVPITAVVLLDASESMQGIRLPKALEGANVFVKGLAELDQAMVLLFSDRLLRATSFSSDPTVLTAALSDIQIQGGTAVNDHLYLALKQLEAQPGRPVVVLFSDGVDVHSALPMREVLWKVGRSQALIYWLLLEGEGKQGGDTISSAWRNGDGNKQEVELLKQAVEQSGGEVHSIARPEELVPAFTRILGELREQYVLGYYPSNLRHDGSWHKVKVEARPMAVRARHRGGYVDE